MSDGEFQLIPDEHTSEGRFRKQLEDQLFWASKEDIAKFWEEQKNKPMTGIELITQERLEHKIKHGKSVKHDSENNGGGELLDMTLSLLEHDIDKIPEEWDQTMCSKMLRKSYLDRLVIAGALIAAEIDRLNYKA